ncbi:MAG: CoA activase [Deltaproteobacteria bacterium]|nr:CoA activase [Deltaproteobacteria bacterium]MBW2330066.1 CoA activase [Deltaproteobacteria bacterium]
MKKVIELDTFRVMSERVGRFNAQGKRFLIPEMNRIGSHLIAGVFRGFGINASVMETYKGLDLGKEFTSGKECFPCVVTLGDILLFMKKERERLGNRFNPENYMYFMPESDGPCRFGMYNKYHRIVLDSFPDLDRVKIASLSSEDAYSADGLIPKERMRDFRKAAYLSMVVGDIVDRLLWRIRPYEKEEGAADKFINEAMGRMAESFSKHSCKKSLFPILNDLVEIVREGKGIIDPNIPRKPLIGVVGEIYVRSHLKSNQDTIRTLEKYGAEAINASIAEWVNYTTYDQLKLSKIALRLNLKRFRLKEVKESLLKYLKYSLTLFHQYKQQRKAYGMVRNYIDIEEDHKIGHLEKVLKKNNTFSFEVGTEACLSIAAALEYAHMGYNGVVNIFPFTCMPSNLTSSIAKPLMAGLNIPYIDVSYDGSFQPGREAALRTFMYQAYQHLKTHGRS